jgi:ribosome maturation factor RimP
MRYRAESLHRLLEPVVTGLGYELVGVEQQSGGRGGLVRVYIDQEDGVTVDDCALVSEQLSGFLDVENPIRGSYTLEVSSPGFDRPLFTMEHYRRFRGRHVRIRLLRLFEGRRQLSGQLVDSDEDTILIEDDGIEYRIPVNYIDSGRLVPE